MIKISPQFVYDEDGNKVGAVLSVRDFEKCVEALEDFQDYKLIEKRRNEVATLIPLQKILDECRPRIRK